MPNGDFLRLLQHLSTSQMGPAAQDNTAMLTQWANIPRGQRAVDPNSYQARQGDPSFANLLRSNPSYVERTSPDYITRRAQDYVPYFYAGMSDPDIEAMKSKLEAQITAAYPGGLADQDEATPEGQAYWDSLRALNRAVRMRQYPDAK